MAEKEGRDAISALRIRPLMQRAMALGSKPWNRSKVMIVGEGRVGKTALCNSMMGQPFVDTESTVGLAQLTFDVRRAAATSNGRWVEHTKPEREFEAGVAQLVRNMESSERAEKDTSQQPSNDRSVSVESEDSTYYNNNVTIAGSLLKTRSESTHQSNESKINSSAPPLNADMSLVMKYLAEVKVSDADLILSLFDFGGQSVFNIIHHLFLTSYGVYLLVFNMMDILDDNKREQSLSEMSFWINSIVMHTRDAMSGLVAPVFLVGTHKDYINDAVKFERISQIIEEIFHYNVGWPHIQENKNSTANYSLCFFPVSNKVGLRDDVVMDLMSAIEVVVKDAEYVKEPRPLTWLKALDELMATKKSYLPMTEASSIAIANGVERDGIPLFLSFLNEMGVVLWLNEEGLRDVVILDIINFFVEPATLIICNHISKPSDSTIHHKKIQETCKKKRAKAWDEMTQRGLVSRQLMEFLLSHKVEAGNIPIIMHMMLKYGLIVRLEHVQGRTSKGQLLPSQPSEYYLVPALLPASEGNPTNFQDSVWNHVKNYNSCYFVFSTATDLISLQSIPREALRKECFLPRGLMERLTGKAVQWSQLTNFTNTYDDVRLYQNYAVLCYGRQQFRLVCIPEINCIRLDIEGEHPLPVYDRIREQIALCVKECMGCLQFITALRRATVAESEECFTLLNFEPYRAVQREDICITAECYPAMSPQVNFGAWIINSDILESYDVFISHRWHIDDDEVIDQLYDSFLGHVVGSEKRAVRVFYDKVRLKNGQQFQEAFGKSLINSTILVPIVCATALQKMLTHNASCEDNVLIEWMLALECMQDPIHTKMRGIYPVMFGRRNADESVGNLFAEGVIDRLPERIPTASIEIVRNLLEQNNVTVSSSLTSRTVRGVVSEIIKFIGLRGWEYPNRFVYVASEYIVHQLKKHSDAGTT